jgi:hypothetical protein
MLTQSIWLRLTLAALATWRIGHLLAAEDGPGDLFARIRMWLGDGFWGRLMDCFYCLSLWIAAPMALLITRKASEWPLVWLALSGAACLLERATENQSDQSFNQEEWHGVLREPTPTNKGGKQAAQQY